MTRTIELNTEVRKTSGTSSARAERAKNRIPAILYGLKKENESFSIAQNDVLRELSKPGFRTHLFDLKIGSKTQKALIKAIQFHSVTDLPIHIDFQRVDKTSKFEILVPIKFINHEKSPGIKRGGTLNTVTHKINVMCTIDNIPEYIYIDLAGLKGGDRVSMSSLKLPEGVMLARNSQPTVCTLIKGRGKGASAEDTEE
ncbi:MAG: 50S ribosomal protein L25/general stress protein Ctc [Candidatus Paracaedibacteraceae bacterium]|nr:50S ribosomal protein L25/general stress protein Ctc [Candidatus Paracaedibacteraceae bacterium]